MKDTNDKIYDESTETLKRLGVQFPSYISENNNPNSQNLHSQVEWPEKIDEVAYYGVAGELVKLIEPHTEADSVALLINFLTGFGSMIGDKTYFRVEADKHPGRLFSILVGKSAKGRKGTSWGYIRNVFNEIDPNWATNQIQSGLSSGEGLVWAVRDEIYKTDVIKEKGKVTGYQQVISDEGVKDKRLLAFESEFASVLRILSRDGNILSPIIRDAWDTGNLQLLTKNNPARATGAHISAIAHITTDELLRYLTSVETSNGFANRFLYFCVERSKILPHGGDIQSTDFSLVINKIKRASEFAKQGRELKWHSEASLLWEKIYPELSGEKSGLVGKLITRAEAYVIRVAIIYAILDMSDTIKSQHLKAALAVWQYSEQSVEYIFQSRQGDKTTDEIYNLLLENPKGLTKTQISNYFQRHKTSDELTSSITTLSNLGLVHTKSSLSEGRTIEIWITNSSELRKERKNRILDNFKKYEEELNSQNSHSQELLNKIEDKIPDLPKFQVDLEISSLDELQICAQNLSKWIETCPSSHRTSIEFDQAMAQQRQVATEISKREKEGIPF